MAKASSGCPSASASPAAAHPITPLFFSKKLPAFLATSIAGLITLLAILFAASGNFLKKLEAPESTFLKKFPAPLFNF